MKLGCLGIQDPRISAESAYNTSKEASEFLIGSLLGGTELNYVEHKGCIHRAIADRWNKQELLEKVALTRWKDLEDGVGLNCLRRATDNRGCLTDIPYCLNGMELSRELFQYNLLLRYGIFPLNLPTYCDCCSKKFSVPHTLSCPEGGLVLVRHNDDAKEWGDLFA